ncbi:MAG: hypothetical protein HYW86_00250 [Candidatus Roizmanbacteria bacterium]|nr:MAG: hypothetical protein HYW86_00250 [Candidatus Roizmanbacteria bacterium]
MLKKKLKDPLFFISLITFAFWLADAYLKIFILKAPQRMLWYSATGLGLTTIALMTRNSFLITSMFCALVINESIWTISFISNFFLKADIVQVADYAFKASYSKFKFIVTSYHLFLVPALVAGLLVTKKIHRLGWLGAYFFASIVAVLAYILPDPFGENINCVRSEGVRMTESCKLYFSSFYNGFNDFPMIFIVTAILAYFVYLPINYLLLFLGKRMKQWGIQ